MLLALSFALGIFNFAVHKGVLESGHPMLTMLPDSLRANGGRVSLLLEFAVLLAALMLVGGGHVWALWTYLIYSMVNVISGLMVISGRL